MTRKTGKIRGGDKTNVLLEDLDKKFDLILEGHKALDVKFDKKTDHLGQKLDEFRYETRTEASFLKLGQSVLTNQVKDLSLKSEKNFVVIREYLGRIDDEIQDLKKRLISKADLERLERLEQKLVQIELVVKKHYGKDRN